MRLHVGARGTPWESLGFTMGEPRTIISGTKPKRNKTIRIRHLYLDRFEFGFGSRLTGVGFYARALIPPDTSSYPAYNELADT